MPGDADGFNCPRPLFGDSFEPATLDLPGAGMELLDAGGGIEGKDRDVGGPAAGVGRDQGAAAAGTPAFVMIGIWG